MLFSFVIYEIIILVSTLSLLVLSNFTFAEFCSANIGLTFIFFGAEIVIYLCKNIAGLIEGYSIQLDIAKKRTYLDITKMKIKDIKTIYNLNPKRWGYDPNNSLIYYSGKEIIYVYTSFFGYIYLTIKRKSQNKRNKKMKALTKEKKGLEIILNTAQKDINDLKNTASKQINLGEKITNQVLKNLKTGE